MHGRRLGAILVVGMLAIPGLAAAQVQHGGAPAGHAGAVGGHGPVAGARPGGPPVAPPAGGVPRGGHFTGADGSWRPHPPWVGGGVFNRWRTGHWWRGNYEGRLGAWWIVGPDWYWYPTEVAVIPDPYTPPGMTPGYWYWCDPYQQYYPYVGACPTPWRQVTPQ
jgi:hypothetical protein